MKVCVMYVILKTFSLGFPKRVKAVASVLTVREKTYTYETTGGNLQLIDAWISLLEVLM